MLDEGSGERRRRGSLPVRSRGRADGQQLQPLRDLRERVQQQRHDRQRSLAVRRGKRIGGHSRQSRHRLAVLQLQPPPPRPAAGSAARQDADEAEPDHAAADAVLRLAIVVVLARLGRLVLLCRSAE